jgi:hypothetical protein
MRSLEAVGELRKPALRQRRIRQPVGFVARAADPGAQRLGQMLEDVARLVDLAPLHQPERATRLANRLAQSRPAVDDEERRPIEVEAALAQVGEQGFAHRRVLRRALAQSQDGLRPLRIQAQGQGNAGDSGA